MGRQGVFVVGREGRARVGGLVGEKENGHHWGRMKKPSPLSSCFKAVSGKHKLLLPENTWGAGQPGQSAAAGRTQQLLVDDYLPQKPCVSASFFFTF